ncbi:MAG: nitroreductase family protein [Actinomycetota bacterium]
MEVYEAIISRRMIGKVASSLPSRGEIEKLIVAAAAAPNHHLTNPWRFIVLTDKALDDLGNVGAERLRRDSGDAVDLEQKMDTEKARVRRAPVILTVVYSPSGHPKAIEVEDRYAVGAAVENILLAAHEMGLGAYWRTGPAAGDPGVHSHLGLGDKEEIAAFVYLGYPLGEQAPVPRTKPPAKTTWLGWP